MKHKINTVLAVTTMLMLLGACSGNENDNGTRVEQTEPNQLTEKNTEGDEAVSVAGTNDVTAALKNSNGEKVGTAVLSNTPDGVRVQLNVSNLPAGTHGFHIHEVGKCLAPNFKSAGGHFNPTDAAHGREHSNGAHAGDLPNLQVGEKGSIEKTIIAKQVTLEKGEIHSLLDKDGSALVIHETEDDGKSQPSGAAGKRIVCGVIGE